MNSKIFRIYRILVLVHCAFNHTIIVDSLHTEVVPVEPFMKLVHDFTFCPFLTDSELTPSLRRNCIKKAVVHFFVRQQ